MSRFVGLKPEKNVERAPKQEEQEEKEVKEDKKK